MPVKYPPIKSPFWALRAKKPAGRIRPKIDPNETSLPLVDGNLVIFHTIINKIRFDKAIKLSW